ncbi:DUF4974 domain-containing protein [Pseudoflavitalea sp. G-6-1-2]|uniref:FecR family protein n=1 Tax=Pseudoflavitalea sp. G-6-1-2 TaxID=2728841 RepID=UPI00146ECD9A|nr:FecR domain-containing protein [Pseudoflavitalea sp. G-6-1-2]NML23184.1 DUF4974 domain-containing protein [Pseudoflavitalea sp. G-6-1-2]
MKKFLDNQCTPEELEQVDQLLQLPAYNELLDKLIAEQTADDWENTGYADETLQSTVEQWKSQLNQRIAATSQGKVGSIWKRNLRNIAAVSAGLLIIGGISFLALKKSKTEPTYVVQHNTGGAPVRHLLPDSTAVYLAAGSHIRYEISFQGNTREVFLDGEAFFDVRQDHQKPFIIQSGEVHTEVLGTSFRITAFKGAPLQVAVASGKVQVTDHQKGQSKKLAVLSKGRAMSYDPVSGSLEQQTTDPATLQKWAAGEVSLENQRLDRITEELHRIYGVHFRFNQSTLPLSRISAAFSATEPIANVMEMLAYVGKFQYSYDNKKQLFTLYTKNNSMHAK